MIDIEKARAQAEELRLLYAHPLIRKIGHAAADTIDALIAEVRDREDVLERAGFRRCDISACNCGSWHQVGGFKARFDEIKEAIAEHVDLDGKTLLTAVQEALAERNALARDAARYRWLRQPNPLHREAHIAVLTHNGGWVASEEKADAAIDAAMKGASDES